MTEVYESRIESSGSENGCLDGECDGPVLNDRPKAAKDFVMPTAKLSEIKVTKYMLDCLDKVAVSEGFEDYEVVIDHGAAIGDGFVGLICKATIQEKNSDKELIVVMKIPPYNVAKRTTFGAMRLFKREVFIYTEVLPEFVKIQKEKEIKESIGFYNFPKVYFAEFNEEKDDAIIIMEDLREGGFRMWDKFEPTNFEHTKLVMAALGRLHAISFALKVQKPELFEKFKALEDFLSERMTDDNTIVMLEAQIASAVETLDTDDIDGRSRALKLKESLREKLRSCGNSALAEPYAVVNHGDCWSNNFMYWYKGEKPDRICLLDWQLSRYSSPVLDLVYFLFICTDQEMRAQHFDELLSTYHNALSELLDALGGDTATQFPFEALLQQLEKFGKFGIYMALTILPMLTTKNDELPDMDFIAENMNSDDSEMKEKMIQSFQTSGNCDQRLRGALLDALSYNYL